MSMEPPEEAQTDRYQSRNLLTSLKTLNQLSKTKGRKRKRSRHHSSNSRPESSQLASLGHQAVLEHEALDLWVDVPAFSRRTSVHLFLEEDREFGRVSSKVFFRMIEALGGWFTAFLIVLMTIAFVTFYNLNILIYSSFAKAMKKGEDTFIYIYIFAGGALFAGVMSMGKTLICLGKGVSASKSIHSRMVFQILHASISDYFDRVPFGQLLNRFSSDIELVDRRVFWMILLGMIGFFYAMVNFVSIVIGASNLLLLLPCGCFFVITAWYRERYMSAKREMVRLFSISKSPLCGWAESMIKGSTVIRATRRQKYSVERMAHNIEENTKNGVVWIALESWFVQRVLLWSWLTVVLPAYSYIIYLLRFTDQTIDFGFFLLFVMSSSRLSSAYRTFINIYSELEIAMIALERCKKFEGIETEKNYTTLEDDRKNYEIPKNDKIFDKSDQRGRTDEELFPRGEIVIKNLTARYPSRAEPALDNISVKIEPGLKVGIVGRTGAGKSSFIKLLPMILVPESGSITIDGKNLEILDLKQLRENITVLSQKTSLFEGSLLENIDPYLEKKEDIEKIEQLLTKMKIENAEFKKSGLGMMLSAEGANLSQGERQTVSFVRAVHKRKKVVVFDEATSKIDLNTEELFREAVGEHFEGCTMLIIAHRLQTVMGCDKILVFDQGGIVDYDSPENLRKNKLSIFNKLCEKMEEEEMK